ncbi:MAG: metallophosphoesterase [Planctomycetes bacterium]|nr:metallophosphoesterase [Planctomycetota bacterium]
MTESGTRKKNAESWCFVYVADIQPGSPRSFRYNPSWQANWEVARKQIIEVDPELLLVGGDLTRDGSVHPAELEEMKADLDQLPFPVHAVPGNMDTGNKHTDVVGRNRGPDQCSDVELNVTSAQLQRFASIVGPLWWSFDHRGVRFSGVADMVINSGLPEEQEFWQWAEEQAEREPADHHVWITHYPPFADRPDESDWDLTKDDEYIDWYFTIDQPGRGRLLDLFSDTETDIVISGHVHCHRVRETRGIRFEIAPATSFSQWGKRWPDGDPTLGFLRYDVTADGIESTLVPLRKTHQLEGYGPGGHPASHVRDYSLAWEKPSMEDAGKVVEE